MGRKPRQRPGIEFGVVLQRHLDDASKMPGQKPRPRVWLSVTEFAKLVGCSDRTVRNWLNGFNIPDDLTQIELALFGPDPEKYREERDELRAVARNGRYKRTERPVLPERRSTLTARVLETDLSGDLPFLNYQDIDHLPADDDWKFDEVRYGEGAQIVRVPGNTLYWLPPAATLLERGGERRSLTSLLPQSDDALDNLARQSEIYFPRRIIITGVARPNTVVRMFACTDMPYPNGLHDRQTEYFETEALLGLGGLAAFLDRNGQFRQLSSSEMGNGLGSVVALAAVAYVHRRPVYRSPYCLVVRKGIRYTDDVWLSPATGQPVFSGIDPLRARFLFQSRESKGGSTDMFAANFNGSALVNLNEGDESAWDGFTDEAGRDFVSWNGGTVSFASMLLGNGLREKITREDRP